MCNARKVPVRNLSSKTVAAQWFMIDIIILQRRGPDHCTHPRVTGVSRLDSSQPFLWHLDVCVKNLFYLPVRKDGRRVGEKGIDPLWHLGKKKAKKFYEQRAETRELRYWVTVLWVEQEGRGKEHTGWSVFEVSSILQLFILWNTKIQLGLEKQVIPYQNLKTNSLRIKNVHQQGPAI